jgi:uncharacterized protein (UPF0261 family)
VKAEQLKRPTIVCTGMCDTKEHEIRYLAEEVAEHGGRPIIMDLSLGAAVDWADVSLPDVLAATGCRIEDVLAAPRATASQLVGEAGAVKILELAAHGDCDGILSWAGSVGTTTACRVMRALPLGVPKIMMTDMAAGDVSRWLGNTDIYIVNPILEQGINVVTRRAVAHAAAAIVAMAMEPEVAPASRPLCAITSYGTTTPTVLRCKAYMEERGWDTAVFHAVGAGATMEDLIRSHLITAIIDITTGELTNTHFGSPYGMPRSWPGQRLSAAGELGIPQVVVPGGLDQCAWGPLDTMPQVWLDDFRAQRRHSYRETGLPYQHNEGITIMVPTLEEVEIISRYMVEKLNQSRGPTMCLIPMRGWSAYDQSEALATRERGWARGNGDGPVWEPDPGHPQWSRRALVMLQVLREGFDACNDNLDLLATDHHILDPDFAKLLTTVMGEMLDHRWRKGAHRELSIEGMVVA